MATDNEHSNAILKMMNDWAGNEFVRKMPTFQLGQQILSAIRNKLRTTAKASVIPIFETTWDTPPQPAHVLIDLMNSPSGSVRAVELGKCTASDHEAANVVLSHTGLGDRPGVHGYKVLNVLVVTGMEEGILMSRPNFSGDLVAPTTYIQPSVAGGPNPFQVESTLVGAGSISSIHFDFHIQGQLLFHLIGAKAWFNWPGTAHNLDAWATRYQRTEEQTVDDYMWAIETLEDMSYTFISSTVEDLARPTRKSFFMKPYTIHMVISFTQSFHSAMRVIRQEWLGDVERGLTWDLHVLRNPTGSGSTMEASVVEGPSLKADADMWGALAKQVSKGRGAQVEEVASRMLAMKAKTYAAVKEFEAALKEKEKAGEKKA